jgi:rhodanese-related sulfurtransferase
MTSTIQASGEAQRGVRWIVAGIVLVGGATPVILYWLLIGRAATVTPQRARELLRQQGESVVLVDVRKPEEFSARHIDGAVNWPLQELRNIARSNGVPPQFRNKTLLLICDVGWASAWAAWHLGTTGIQEAFNVRGGIQEWIHSARGAEGEAYERWRIGPDGVVEFPVRQSPLWEQAVAVFAYLWIKPVYTILSLLLVIVLWGSRSPELAALRWGLIFFFLGENACAVNVSFFQESSYLSEYLHSLGMALCFGFTSYAVLEGVDRRILRLSDPHQRCASLGFCGACIKYTDVPCGLKQMFYLIIPLCIVLALMLPSADWQDNVYNTAIFGTFYNYGHLRVYQLLENWYCPAVAILLFAASLSILGVGGQKAIAPAKVTFAAGLGPLGFGSLRMILGSAYDQNRVWYVFWEEFTELLLMLAVGFVLWTFRRQLLPQLDTLYETFRKMIAPAGAPMRNTEITAAAGRRRP